VRPHGRQGAGADPRGVEKLNAARLAADVLGVPTCWWRAPTPKPPTC
jgi:hypothetical protein